MKILITGGTGFIGSHLVERLLKEKHELILLKNSFSNTWRIKSILKKLQIYEIDRLDNLESIFKKYRIDIVIHLAAKYLKQDPSFLEIKQMNYFNITVPTQLLDIASKFKVKGFINTGTFFEYKLDNRKKPISERSPKNPYNYYTVTKIAFEEILKYYCVNSKIKGVTLKLFSPYGEKDNEKIIPIIIKSFIQNKELNLTKGDQKLSFTYIDDIVDAYIEAIDFINKKKFEYDNFNIGSNQSYSIKQLIKIISRISRKKNIVNLGQIKSTKDEKINIQCDYGKAKKYLNWRPKTDVTSGLGKTYKYYFNALV